MNVGRWLLGAVGGVFLVATACAPVAEVEPAPEEPVRERSAAPTPEARPLPGPQGRVAAAIKSVQKRRLRTDNAFWTVFHGILGLGPNVELFDPRNKEKVKALDFICKGGHLRGLEYKQYPLLDGVEVVSKQDTEGQGHQDQFIAEMAQWGMPAERKFRVQGKEYAFLDFVKYSQLRASTESVHRQELSWTIIVVSQYLDVTKAWTNIHGKKLTLEDLVDYELNQPIDAEKSACGGTHRLFGLSWVYHQHLRRGGKTEGVWKRVAEKTQEYRDRARATQNANGLFSTSYFNERALTDEPDRRIGTTGHILEWLALALTDEELRQEWVQNAANALSLQIIERQGQPIDSGGMYHAVHGLLIYYARVYGRAAFIPRELLVPLPPGWKPV